MNLLIISYKKILLTVLVTFALLGLSASFAANVDAADLFSGSKDEACKAVATTPAGNCDQDKLDESSTTLTKRINSVLDILSVIVGIIAVIMIIIGGLRYITSNGDSGNVTSARNTILYAIVGLIVVALAQTIVKYVLNRIYG